MRSEWQSHKGQPFFFCNYAALEVDELESEMDYVRSVITQQPRGTLLILTDVRGIQPTREILAAFMKIMPQTKNHLRKSAIIGVGFSGQSKVLFDAVLRITGGDAKVFDEIEKAKDWLVEA